MHVRGLGGCDAFVTERLTDSVGRQREGVKRGGGVTHTAVTVFFCISAKRGKFQGSSQALVSTLAPAWWHVTTCTDSATMHKPRIRTILGLSRANLGFDLRAGKPDCPGIAQSASSDQSSALRNK